MPGLPDQYFVADTKAAFDGDPAWLACCNVFLKKITVNQEILTCVGTKIKHGYIRNISIITLI